MNSFKDDPWQPPPANNNNDTPSPTIEDTPRLRDVMSSGVDVGDLDEEGILNNQDISFEDKSAALQKILFIGSSNGDVDRVHELLSSLSSSEYIDVDAKDESGSTALIYSSCFGNEAIVQELLRNNASVDEQDKHEWTALMWAINNHHLSIVKLLVEYGASVTIKTSTGRSALDFMSPHGEIYNYMKSNGYIETDNDDDFYDDGKVEGLDDYSQQLMAESAYNLDVDMAHLNLDDIREDVVNTDVGEEDEGFVWERCLPDQMFVFNDADIPRILDETISKMEPQRSASQKPIPANIIFLSARYALNFGTPETMSNLLDPFLSRTKHVATSHKEDLAFLAFWLSNCTLLIYYLRKDSGLHPATTEFQQQLSDLITDIYLLITQDVERRLDKVLDACILDHDTIPGLDNIHYQSEWRIFRAKHKQLSHREEMEQVTRPPSPKRKALPSPRNVTSILSSVLFVMDLYDVHPIVTQQIMSQIFYWLGSSLFNRIMNSRKYLARSRAMQIRLNVSAIEDWARANNRRPEDLDEFHEETSKYPSIVEICRKHFSSLVQILQWLQCFTGFGDDFTNVVATLQQLTSLNPFQLLHVANKYRAEVGEKGLSKEYKNYLSQLTVHYRKQQITHHGVVDKEQDKKEVQSANDNDDDNKNKKEDEEEKNDEAAAAVKQEPDRRQSLTPLPNLMKKTVCTSMHLQCCHSWFRTYEK